MLNCRPNTARIIQAMPSPLIVKACKHGFKSQDFYQLSEFGQSIQLAQWPESIGFDWQLFNYPTCTALREASGPALLYCISIYRVTENTSLQMKLILEMDTNLFWVIPHQLKLSWNLASGKLTTIVVHAPGATKGKWSTTSFRVQPLACTSPSKR